MRDSHTGQPLGLHVVILVLLPLRLLAAQFEQHGVHEHGKVAFNVALDGESLVIDLDAPADNVVGFEHPPHTDAERAEIQGASRMLQAGDALFGFSPNAQCHSSAVELHEPQWQANSEHADYEARFSFRCQKPEELQWLELRLLSKLKEVHEARVNVLTSARQASQTVESARARISLR